MISEVDEALSIDIKGSKRIINFRDPKKLARTMVDTLPDTLPVSEFNLNEHLETLRNTQDAAAEFEL